MVTELGMKINPAFDSVTVDGQRVGGESVVGGLSREAPQPRWVILYKPKGTIVTPVPGGTQKTVLSLVAGSSDDRLLPVGRLDRNTAGLIILTNEKIWLHPLTHPSYALGRRYIAVVKRIPKAKTISDLSKGITPPGYKRPIKPTSVKVLSSDKIKKAWCKLEIGFGSDQSRPRDIRKALEIVGHPVQSLTRSAIGPFQISKQMKAGQWRDLGEKEISEIKQTLRQKMVKANPNMKLDQVAEESSDEIDDDDLVFD
eukprot:CAMPEP_0184494394 /NCGR_PEP_ID=MMETSP0113_2-20130426/28597_1 /TAXON_ID=91329 /ORGANISM="Norrisiella sphaerica, Strain BC52" /LENGTH=255 /DNA_ID=CAMNT_0026880131 /DNA_START=3 /DNA_END=770 /DNA_ORIENTATION=+